MSGMQHTDGKEAEANEPHGEDKKVPAPPPVVEYMFNDRPQRSTENVADRIFELPDEGYDSKTSFEPAAEWVAELRASIGGVPDVVLRPGERSGTVSGRAEQYTEEGPACSTEAVQKGHKGTPVCDTICLDPYDPSHINTVYEDLNRSFLKLDNFALLARATSDRDFKRMKLCLDIGRIYLEFGQLQQALALVTEGISLSEKLDGESRESRPSLGLLYCVAAEAYEGLRQRRNAVHYYHLAKEYGNSSDVYGVEMHHRLKKFQLLMSRNGEDDGRTRITKTIGHVGGEIVLVDGQITFNENSFTDQTILHVSTVDDADNGQGDLVQISPTMRLAPNINLKTAADVILTTWAYPSDAEQAFVYFRESHTSLWKDPRPITLQEDGSAKFEIEKFCEYGIFIHVKAAMYWNFKIQACSFVNKDTKKISNRLTPKCETCADSLIRKMAVVNFEPICTENPTLIVKVEDEVEVRLENIRDESGDKPAPPTKRAKITIDFLKDKSQGVQDFPLHRDCKGLVEFNHIVQLYRRDEAIGNPTTHDADRINLNARASGGTYVTAGAIVTDHGRLRMSGGNLDVQHEAN